VAGAGSKKYSYEHGPAGAGYPPSCCGRDSVAVGISVAVGAKGLSIAAGVAVEGDFGISMTSVGAPPAGDPSRQPARHIKTKKITSGIGRII